MTVSPLAESAAGRAERAARQLGSRAPLSITRHLPGTPGRERLESFVAEVFRDAYGAQIGSFYPELLRMTRADGTLAAVAGVRGAGDAALFAEHYLDAPVEQLLARCLGHDIDRHRVVEVGNLAPVGAGQARAMIATLTGHLLERGFDWVVFTAVPVLFNAFARMGLSPVALARADPGRLTPEERTAWGSYYERAPRVCVGSIRDGARALDARCSRDGSWSPRRRDGLLAGRGTVAVEAGVRREVAP